MAVLDNSVALLTPRFDLSFEDEPDADTNEEIQNGGCSERSGADDVNEIRSFCEGIKHGGRIIDVCDDKQFTDKTFGRILTLKSPKGDTSHYQITKSQPGPVQCFHNNDENSLKFCFLTTESQLVLIEECYSEDSLRFVFFYVNLMNGKWLEYHFDIPLGETLGTHTFTFESNQLLLYFNRPVKIFAFNFPTDINTGDVIVQQWVSSLNAYRILTCFNFVMLFTNEKTVYMFNIF